MNGRSETRKLVYLGLMVGMAMGLHIFESMFPIPAPFPGAKLGLANIITLFVVVAFGPKEAVVVTLMRTILGSLMMGTFFSITFFLSFFGGIASSLVMGITYRFLRDSFSLVGISVLGALTHNVVQVGVAAYFVSTAGIFFYLPYLLLFALPTGFFVGLVTKQMTRYYRPLQYSTHPHP